MGEVWTVIWCYSFKFLEEIRLHWLFHVGFGEIRFFKWHDVANQFKFLVFGNIKSFHFRFALIQANIFFLKLNRILTKLNICYANTIVLDPPTHSHQFDANGGKIRYVSDPLKQTSLVFALYIIRI